MKKNIKLPDGWSETKLKDVILSANTGLDAIKRAPIVSEDTGVKCFRIQDASQKKTYSEWGNTLVEEKNYNKFKLTKGDILIARTGNTIGVNYLVKENLNSVFNNGLIRLRVNDNIDYEFLYKVIESKDFEKYIQSIAYGTSTQPNMQINVLLEYNFLLPSISEQKSIAKLLTSFDKKIEILKEQNKILEDLAQTIFKEWFGKYLSEKKLPLNWMTSKLGEEFDITIGRTPPRIEKEWFSSEPIGKKWISIKDMGNAGVYIFETSEFLTNEAIKKFNIPIIPENTTIISFKMTVGKLSITTEEMLSNEAIAHLKIKADNSRLNSEYIYLYLQNLDFNSLGSTSSIAIAVNSTLIKQIDVIVPDNKIMSSFNNIIKPIFDKIKSNSKQILTQLEIRDTLLPKLMMGEIIIEENEN